MYQKSVVCVKNSVMPLAVDEQSLERIMMETREPLEWHFKQLDHSMGLSFKTNFNFALVGHLLKGWPQMHINDDEILLYYAFAHIKTHAL